MGEKTLNNIMTVKQSLKRKSMHIDNKSKDGLKRLKTMILQNQIYEENNNSEPITINLHQ